MFARAGSIKKNAEIDIVYDMIINEDWGRNNSQSEEAFFLSWEYLAKISHIFLEPCGSRLTNPVCLDNKTKKNTTDLSPAMYLWIRMYEQRDKLRSNHCIIIEATNKCQMCFEDIQSNKWFDRIQGLLQSRRKKIENLF